MDPFDKARIKLARVRHDTHVNLLMQDRGMTKTEATIMAYLDGYNGFQARREGGIPAGTDASPIGGALAVARELATDNPAISVLPKGATHASTAKPEATK